MNSLWLVAVWPAAGRDLQHVVRTVLREELQEEERSHQRGPGMAEAGGGLPGAPVCNKAKLFLSFQGAHLTVNVSFLGELNKANETL